MTSKHDHVHDVTGADASIARTEPTPGPGPGPAVLQVGPARLTGGFDQYDRIDRTAHELIHGRPCPRTLGDLADLAAAGSLCERDATAYPFARKLRAVADAAGRRSTRPVVVIDGAERDPGSAKDGVLLTRAPHLVLDGAVLAATALGAKGITVAVADAPAAASVRHAIMERDMAATSRVVQLSETFLADESGPPVRAAYGIPGVHQGGVHQGGDRHGGDLPVLLSNAETLAQLAVLASLGVREYREVGIAPEPGTVLLTVTGSAGFPAVVEIPSGAPLIHVLDLCRASAGDGVLVGGYHGAWLCRQTATAAEVSRESMTAAGGVLGAGVIMPIGRRTCPLGECAGVVRRLAADAAGCVPCRAGLMDMAAALSALAAGRDGTAAALRALRAVAGDGRDPAACRHLGGAARFAASAFDVFAADVTAHLGAGGCGRSVLGLLPIRRFAARRPRRSGPRPRG